MYNILEPKDMNEHSELGIMRCVKYVPICLRHQLLRPRSSWGHMCAPTPIFFCPSPIKIHQSMLIQWPIVHILTIWGQQHQMTPRWLLTPNFVEVACVHIPISFCQSAMKFHQSMREEWAILLRLTFLPHTQYIYTHTYMFKAHLIVPFFS